MFESITDEARTRFNLGDKADRLLSALLALITDENLGGFAGFLDRFNAAGFGDIASSWINSGANASISSGQTEAALGPVTLDEISNQSGLNYETTVSATAFMLPHIINELTPDGVVPNMSDLHSRVSAFSGGVKASDTIDRFGTAAAETVGTNRGAEVFNQMEEAIEGAEDDSPLRWLIPLIVIVLLIAGGYFTCAKPPEAPKSAVVNSENNFARC